MKLAIPWFQQSLKALRTAALVLSAFSLGTTACTTHPTDSSQQSADTVPRITRISIPNAFGSDQSGNVRFQPRHQRPDRQPRAGHRQRHLHGRRGR